MQGAVQSGLINNGGPVAATARLRKTLRLRSGFSVGARGGQVVALEWLFGPSTYNSAVVFIPPADESGNAYEFCVTGMRPPPRHREVRLRYSLARADRWR